MHSRIKAEITALARATPEVEICGFIYRDPASQPQIFPCRNRAPDPREAFEIDVQDHIRALALGPLYGLYHSHPGEPAGFSRSTTADPERLGDLDYAEELALPLYLVNVADGSWLDYVPRSYHVPLEARPWCLGFSDCWEIPRIHYRQVHGIYMDDYERDESFCHEEKGVILANYAREGFRLVEGGLAAAREHDILLFHTDKLLPQHFGVFLGRGGYMLHHLQNSYSRVELLTENWNRRLVGICRHHTFA